MKKSILITGATSGIGLATVKLFSKNEYTVFATYRKEQDRKTLLQIQNVNPIKMDVTSSVEIENAFRKIAETLGNEGLYAIINNAGITYSAHPFSSFHLYLIMK